MGLMWTPNHPIVLITNAGNSVILEKVEIHEDIDAITFIGTYPDGVSAFVTQKLECACFELRNERFDKEFPKFDIRVETKDAFDH